MGGYCIQKILESIVLVEIWQSYLLVHKKHYLFLYENIDGDYLLHWQLDINHVFVMTSSFCEDVILWF